MNIDSKENISSLSLSSDIVYDLFKSSIEDDFLNCETFISIFEKVIEGWEITKSDYELLNYLYNFWIYWIIRKKVKNEIKYEWTKDELIDFFTLLEKRTRQLFREFNRKAIISTVKWQVNSNLIDENEKLYEIKWKKYTEIDWFHYELLQDYWEYKVLKNISQEISDPEDKILIDKDWKIVLEWKIEIFRPKVINENTYFLWMDSYWQWVSTNINWKEKYLIINKKKIWNIKLIENKIICDYEDEKWIWISEIIWDKEIILIEWQSKLWEFILVEDKIFYKSLNKKWKNLFYIKGKSVFEVIEWKASIIDVKYIWWNYYCIWTDKENYMWITGVSTTEGIEFTNGKWKILDIKILNLRIFIRSYSNNRYELEEIDWKTVKEILSPRAWISEPKISWWNVIVQQNIKILPIMTKKI